jgi:hypothetical protein
MSADNAEGGPAPERRYAEPTTGDFKAWQDRLAGKINDDLQAQLKAAEGRRRKEWVPLSKETDPTVRAHRQRIADFNLRRCLAAARGLDSCTTCGGAPPDSDSPRPCTCIGVAVTWEATVTAAWARTRNV